MAIDSHTPTRIEVHHLTRVEGHGNIVVDARNGVITQCDLEIVEAPRYFEAMLLGQHYERAPRLASRICGICAVTHMTASLVAVEKALGVEISEQTAQLRQLNLFGEMLDSHVLHAYMLIAPDLLGVNSVIDIAGARPDLVTMALRLKRVAGLMCAVVGGRHTHPISMTVGGFSRLPTRDELEELAAELEAIRPDMDATVDLFASVSLPDFERETEYIALQEEGTYCLLNGRIASSDGGAWPLEQYRSVTNEFQVRHSTAKHTRHQRDSYMVGALARLNLNYQWLHPRAQAAAARMAMVPPIFNPFKITVAQVVEIVHCYEEAVLLVNRLLEQGIRPEAPARPSTLSGEGIGACEAPRGTLYHHYVLRAGALDQANCIIPTGQNLANIEADMRAMVPGMLDRPHDDVKLALEMLVRAYDPCISCSTHMLDVRFN
jgi:sulfhydrogenase subunit alpha